MNVYFIRTKSFPHSVKIGKTSDIQRRMKEIQTGCPHDLEIFFTIKCRSEMHAFEVEKLAHEYLQVSNTRGEWFRFTDRVNALIRTIATGALEVRPEMRAIKKARKKEAKKAHAQQQREWLAHIREITRS